MKDQPAAGRRCVEVLGQRHQPNLPVLQILGRGDELLEGACQAIELPHDEGVAPAQHIIEDAFQLRPVSAVAGRLFAKNLLAAGRGQCLELKLRRLIEGRDAGVTDTHRCFSKVSRRLSF
jgi:hypothetical protein